MMDSLTSLERRYLRFFSSPIVGGTIAGLAVYISIGKISFLAYLPNYMMWTNGYYAELFPLTLLVTVVANYLFHHSKRLFKQAGYSPSQLQSARNYDLAGESTERLLGIVQIFLQICICAACTGCAYMHTKLSLKSWYQDAGADTTSTSRCGLNL